MDTGRAVRAGSAALTLGLLASCASGPIAGMFSAPGQQSQPVLLRYESSAFGYGGTLATTLPGGEQFSGRYRLDPKAPGGQMPATLTGNQGNALVCRFTLKEPGVGPDGGGIVRCSLSSGGTFDATY